MDTPIFNMPKNNNLCNIINFNPLWEYFKIFELNEIIRQQSENILANNSLTNADIDLINSRKVKVNEVPTSAIRQ